MNDIDIKDFTPVSGVGGNDNILLVLSSGVNGRISVALFKAAVSDSLKPSIRDGVWWVGDIGTGVVAEGKTPEFRKTETGIEYKYIPDPDTTWRLLVDIADIKLRFEDLTEDEVRMLIPHLKDFTPEEIAELQRPAAEMIAKLEDTDRTVSSNEQTRISNENARIGNENDRRTTAYCLRTNVPKRKLPARKDLKNPQRKRKKRLHQHKIKRIAHKPTPTTRRRSGKTATGGCGMKKPANTATPALSPAEI